MWTRSELKEKARISFQANYWPSVLAAFIISVFAGTAGSSSGRGASSDNVKDAISNNNNFAVIALIFALAVFTAAALITVLKIIVGNTLIVGSERLFIANEADPANASVSNIAFAFKDGNWMNTVLIMFLKDLFQALWTLLFIIPGIIKAYEYRMIPFLLAEDPSMDRTEAFAKSKEMMDGEKWNAFVLDLSFIGWILLSSITLGILGIFYVNPYIHQTNAELYLKLKSKRNY